EKKEKWLLYRIGTWMIDEYLRKHKEKTVLDLLQLKTEDILQALAV
ncbi:MAG: hypothetical protein QG623_677, partial [Patescibacteria group bacterium]|nr:hypothetical protein [Patescibacteria group bacterium]